ncbi:TrkA C-terminal domain-containing protein [Actinomadura fibrosa]
MALVHTGLAKEAAKFQARSAFLGVGFTTKESELVVNNPVRRKILTSLIFFGNAGVVTTISSVVFSVISIERSGFFSTEVLVLVGGLLVLLVLSYSKWVDRKLSRLIDLALRKYTELDVTDYYGLLHLEESYRIAEIRVKEKNWMANKTLDELKLDDEGIRVLGLRRGNGKYIGAPVGETEVREKDIIVLYGRISVLENLEDRQNETGDTEHRQAVNEQEQIEKEQQKEEKASAG